MLRLEPPDKYFALLLPNSLEAGVTTAVNVFFVQLAFISALNLILPSVVRVKNGCIEHSARDLGEIFRHLRRQSAVK